MIASLWIAGEMHYRNCLAQDEAAKVQKGIDYGAVIAGPDRASQGECHSAANGTLAPFMPQARGMA